MRVTDQATGSLIALEDLSDVNFPLAPTHGQTVTFNSATGMWQNTSPASATIGGNLTIVSDPNILAVASAVTNVFLLPITFTFSWLGVLSVPRGGTGVATFGGTNTLLYTPTANTLASIAAANSSILLTNGSGVPAWGTTLPSGVQDLITRLGTVTSGVWNGTRLTYAFLPQLTGPALVGRVTATLGDASALTGAQVGAMITLANLSDVLDGIVPTKGSVLVGDGSAWNVQTVGTDGQALVANSANPSGLGYSSLAGGPGPAGPAGPLGPSPTLVYLYDNSTVNADPGPGNVRLNNSNLTLVTEIYLDDVELGGTNVRATINTFDDLGSSGSRGVLIIRDRDDQTRMAIYTVTGTVSGSGYAILTVTYLSSSAGALAGEVSVFFSPAGPTGSSGAGTGDVTGPVSVVDNTFAMWDGVTGDLLKAGVVPAAGVATFLATPSSANLAAALTDETGTGANVFANSPVLITPALGTPASGVATNLTGLPISTGVSGLGSNVATFLGTPSSANLAAALTDETGTGANVFANSPVLVTPALGTPASGVATNLTGLPISTGVSGLGAGVATFLATPSSANLAAAVTDETGTGALVFAGSPALTGTPTAPTAGAGTNTTQISTTAFVKAAIDVVLGGVSAAFDTLAEIATELALKATLASPTFTGTPAAPTAATGTSTTQLATTAFVQQEKLIPQNSQSAAYTLVLADANKHIFHPSADTTARTFTIPANASVAYPVGTAITFVNQNAGGVITIAITTDTMRLAGAGTTGSRTLAANGVATALKVTSTEWIISGTGLT